jgi:arylsulfatase A-like enzyme
MITRRDLLARAWGCLSAAVLPTHLLAAASVPRGRRLPNILLILADDLGYGELGCQGNPEIPTPHTDSIAKNGIRFTAGYVSGPYCSPTRAGLMTGRYQTRFGHEFNDAAAGTRGLSLAERTMADRLKALGYATCAVGKWHLGHLDEYKPMQRGFDEYYGVLGNPGSYSKPRGFIDSRRSAQEQVVSDDAFYTTDAFGDHAVDWLERHKDESWFLYLPFNAQHAPLEATKKYLDRFAEIPDPKRRTFAAMLSAMDEAIGRVLAKVRSLGQEEDTLIWYLSDNGGPTQSTTSKNDPLRGFKATTWEGGVRIPFMVQWKNNLPAGRVYDHPVIQLDILPTCIAAAQGKVDPTWKLDGINLLPYLSGQNGAKPHETLYWRFGQQWAIRHGNMKLVVARNGSGQPELYDLAQDISESKDLASAQPEKVKELQALWDKWNAEQAPRAEEPVRKKAKPGVNPKRKKSN